MIARSIRVRLVGVHHFQQRQRALEQPPCLRKLTLIAKHDREVARDHRGIAMPRAKHRLADGKPALEQRARLCKVALTQKHDSESVYGLRGIEMLGAEHLLPDG